MMQRNTVKKQKNTTRNFFIEFLLMLLLSTSMVFPFVTALELGQNVPGVLFINAICLVIWTLAFYNKRTMLASIVLVTFAVAAAIYSYTNTIDGAYSLFHEQVSAFQYWAGMYLMGYRSTNEDYQLILILVLSTFVCMFIHLFTVKKLNLTAIVLSGTGCFTALVIIGHIISLPSLFGFILAAILYYLFYNYKKNTSEMSRHDAPKLPAYMASALPLAVVVMLMAILLSGLAKIDPVWMKDIRDKVIVKKIENRAQPIKGSYSVVVSNNELGGNLYLDDTILMDVDSPTGNVYLRSTSKDKYTGHSWEQTDKDITNDKVLDDTYETIHAVPVFSKDAGTLDKLFPQYKLSVTYVALSTGILYAPLKTDNLDYNDYNILGKDTLMLPAISANGFTYSVSFLQPKYVNDEFIDLVRKSRSSFYNSIKSDDPESLQVKDAFQSKANELRSKYTQLPELLPDRVRALADELTSNQSNDYDKAKAIESYLSQNFTYTLTPGIADKSRDFVDQFLFEGKKGYCTYYATAMTVLLRCVGIPARYVEGYILPEKQNSDGVYEVTKKQGHAWVEVYFEGIGWLQFEPTASFGGSNKNAQTHTSPAQTSRAPTAAPSPSTKNPIHTTAIIPTSNSHTSRTASFVLPIILLMFAAALALLFVFPIRAQRGIHDTKPREAVLLLFSQCMKLLAVQGLELEKGETFALFTQRVDELHQFNSSGFVAATEIFHLARYSDHEITTEQKGLMLAFRKALLAKSSKKLGIFKYLFYKYRWAC